MITAQCELLADILDEWKEIIPFHWEELALDKDKVPLDPQFDLYLAREQLGELLLVTLRESGKLIGYFIGFIAPGLHYKTCLTCTMDIFYVCEEYRCRGGGVKLFSFVKQELKRRGVQRWYVGSKCHKDASRLFIKFGFKKIEEYYSVWLGD